MRARLLLLAVSLTLPGCGTNDMASLEAYVAEVKVRPGPPLEPFPVGPAIFDRPTYDPAGERDPFASFVPENKPEGPAIAQPFPDPHPKEELEAYPLDSLRMVGTLSSDEVTYGLVEAPDGIVHTVRAGNYLGQNGGKITWVGEAQIELREIVPDGTGWREREAQLALRGTG